MSVLDCYEVDWIESACVVNCFACANATKCNAGLKTEMEHKEAELKRYKAGQMQAPAAPAAASAEAADESSSSYEHKEKDRGAMDCIVLDCIVLHCSFISFRPEQN